MYFIDFHIPARLLPLEPIHLPEHHLHLFQSTTSCILMQQFEGPSLGLLLYGEKGQLTAERVGSVLADVITLAGCTLPENQAHAWLNDQWLNISRIDSLLKSGDPHGTYLSAASQTARRAKIGIQVVGDFRNLPLPMFPSPAPKINFAAALGAYLSLPIDALLKQKIQLFHTATSLSLILGRTYRNQNLGLSLLLTLLESTLPHGRTSLKATCGHESNKTRDMSIAQRLDKYVQTLDWSDANKATFSETCKQLFRQARNPFYHVGTVATEMDVVDELIAKLGRTSFTLADELEHGVPRAAGARLLENHLRLTLFSQLQGNPVEVPRCF
jgi:hypothetical protein